MTDIAQLGVSVQATGARETADQLARLGRAMGQLGERADQVSRDIGLVQDAQGRWRRSNGQFISGVDRARAVLQRLDLESTASGIGRLQASLDPTVAGMQRFQSAVETLDAALATGRISYTEYERSVELASAKFLGLSSSVEAAERSLTAIQGKINTVTGVTREMGSSAQDAASRFQSLASAQSAIDGMMRQYSQFGAASQQWETANNRLVASVQELNAAAGRTVITTEQLDAMQQRLGRSILLTNQATTQYGTRMGAASAHTTNLLFQLQDIGMMMSMGQNPLLTMAQQGTQVSGVFYQMQQQGMSLRTGLAGAFKAMLSPMTLLTMGAIGAAAGIVYLARQAWMARDRVGSLQDAVDALSESLERMETASSGSVDGFSELIVMGGRYTQTAERILDIQRELANMTAAESVSDAVSMISDDTGFERLIRQIEVGRELLSSLGENQSGLTGELASNYMQQMEAVRDQLQDVAAESGTTVEAVDEYVAALRSLETASGPAQQAEAARELTSAYLATRDAAQQGADINQEFLQALLMIEQAALRVQLAEERRTAARQEELSTLTREIGLQAMINQYGEDHAAVQAERTRLTRLEFEERLRSRGIVGEELQDALALYDTHQRLLQTYEQQNGERETASRVAELQQEAELRLLIAQYGEDSVQVTDRQRVAARGVYEAQVDTALKMMESREEASQLKTELMESWDAARRLQEISGGITFAAAVSSAAELAQQLGLSFERAMALAQLHPGRTASGAAGDPTGMGPGGATLAVPPGSGIDMTGIPTGSTITGGRFLTSPGGGGGGGGGGAAELTAEMRAAEQAIQQAREAAVEFGAVQDALNQRLTEGSIDLSTYNAALEIARDRYTEVGESAKFWNEQAQTLKDGILDAIVNGDSLADTFNNLAKSIARAALEAALFGEGPLAGNLAGTGGILGGLFKGIFGRASGGPVVGGSPYIVGERGPELFVPSTTGRIVPTHASMSDGSASVTVTIDARGAQQGVAEQIDRMLQIRMPEIAAAVQSSSVSDRSRGRAA